MLEVQPSDLEQICGFSWLQGNFHPSLQLVVFQLTVKSHKLKHEQMFVHVQRTWRYLAKAFRVLSQDNASEPQTMTKVMS